jgi:hypothetical protein
MMSVRTILLQPLLSGMLFCAESRVIFFSSFFYPELDSLATEAEVNGRRIELLPSKYCGIKICHRRAFVRITRHRARVQRVDVIR